jgi:uncharacterized radical SAM superfamily Fe-S cluster-containing enzyme
MDRMFLPGDIPFEQRRKIGEKTSKAIYIHSHMDAATFDVQRMTRCCVVVPDLRAGNLPTCAYNILHRAKDPRFCDSSPV